MNNVTLGADRFVWPIVASSWCERHFSLLIGLCLLVATIVRFWQLGNVPVAYFDEINIPQFGWALLNDRSATPFVTAHPPLTHYLFAFAIWLYYLLPWVDGSVHQAWAQIDPLSYRWFTAALGVACVYFAGDWLRRLSGSALAGVLLALFVAIDASLIVDSRAGLNNIVMLALGMSAIWCWQRAQDAHWNMAWLLAAGILFGSVVAVKWNGLGFWLIPVSLLLVKAFLVLVDHYRPAPSGEGVHWCGPDPLRLLLVLLVLPLLTYWFWWQPYLWIEQQGFLDIHQIMRGFHTQQVGADDHPYCSAWYQWPWQLRPMSYLFELQPALGSNKYRVIHQLGNPALYPLGFMAALVAAGLMIRSLWRWFVVGVPGAGFFVLLTLLLGVLANLLPWALVSRCLFSYHYQPASVFSFGLLAWGMVSLLHQPWQSRWLNAVSLWGVCVLLSVVVVAFFYWLPIAVGQPIELDHFYRLMWLKSWI